MDSFFFKSIECRKLTWKFRAILFAGFLLFCFTLYKPILSSFGSFLSVGQSREQADILLIEATNVVHAKAYKTALQLYGEGIGKEIIFALHRTGGIYFGVDNFTEMYVGLLKKELDLKGVPNDVVLLFAKHPVTLQEGIDVAKYVKENRTDIRSVTLISYGFHTRRSLLAYRKAFNPLGITVNAFGYFGEYGNDDWWLTAAGLRTFFSELLKYLYYVCRGWI